MSNLAQYMRKALESGQMVYLPEIGTFRKERIPAFFDALKERFVPPFRNLVLTDEQLAEHSIFNLIRAEKDGQKRRRLIEEEISDLKKDLSKGDEVILEGLGRLRQNGERIEFNASGLAWNDFPEYEELPDSPVLRNPVIPAPVVEEQEVVADDLPVMTGTTVERSQRSWIWLIAALLLAGAVFAWFWYRTPGNLPGEQTASSPQSPAAEQVPATLKTDATALKADTQLGQDPAPAAPDSALAEGPASLAAAMVREPSGRFEIIIAAFHTMEEATEFVERTNAKGYDVYIIKNQRPNNLNKVSYASFDTEREVNEAIAKVRKEINPDAWIYKNKVNQ
jgi:cell division septation protein DedD/nucleoid DNA-binding protein